MLLSQILIIGLLSFVMGKAAQSIAKSVRFIAVALGFSEFMVAFVLLGIATSLPEISVAVFSSLQGKPGLSLGNLIGANIVILSLLCGATTVVAGRIRPHDFNKHRLLPLFLVEVLLPLYAVLDGHLTRVDGMFLISAHILFLVHMSRKHRAAMPQLPTRERPPRRSFWMNVLYAALAVVALLAASYGLVQVALSVAAELGIAPLVIGLLMFSLGTNLPEVTFVLTQSRGNRDIVLGDLFGSVLTNTLTLGLLAMIGPFSLDPAQRETVTVSGIFLVLLTLLFGWCMHTGRELVRREGYWLILFYFAFVAFSVLHTATIAGA